MDSLESPAPPKEDKTKTPGTEQKKPPPLRVRGRCRGYIPSPSHILLSSEQGLVGLGAGIVGGGRVSSSLEVGLPA